MTDFGRFLFGGDYNPDQWLNAPDVLKEDIRLMQLASVTCVSLGIFAWAALEPEEGRFEFGWLDETIERLHRGGISVDLATPSGAKPVWMALKYPEIRRVDSRGAREPQRSRHNHCWTSPIYREKVRIINTRLSERYGKHPAVILWHLSNEYGGACYCDLCFAKFHRWLRERYGTIEALNQAYWSAFWSHTVRDWDEITCIDDSIHGLQLDWQRFTSLQAADFIAHEVAAIRAGGSQVPVTTNMMGFYDGLNTWDQVSHLDYVSYDAYPDWHSDRPDWQTACETAFTYDLYRQMKGGRPWILMESTPSNVNWKGSLSRPKQPGMVRLSGLQAVAHGSTSVMYFQWRKGRGGVEKFHGAVVDHVGDERTRTFQEAAALGGELARAPQAADARTRAQVGLIFDWDVRWSLNNSAGPNNRSKNYQETCLSFYRPLWRRGVAVDVIDSLQDYSGYKVLIAPMLYMLRPGVAERMKEFVQQGGILAATYLTGQVNESDLCWLGGFPGPLRGVFGVWDEETDVPSENVGQSILADPQNDLGLAGSYAAQDFCDVIHLEGARVLASYEHEFYAGAPAVTVNELGRGAAYYAASRNDERFQDDFVGGLLQKAGVAGVLNGKLPEGVSATSRETAESRYTFVMNFNRTAIEVPLPASPLRRLSDGVPVSGRLKLDGFGCEILESAL